MFESALNSFRLAVNVYRILHATIGGGLFRHTQGASLFLEGDPGQHGPPGCEVQNHASCEFHFGVFLLSTLGRSGRNKRFRVLWELFLVHVYCIAFLRRHENGVAFPFKGEWNVVGCWMLDGGLIEREALDLFGIADVSLVLLSD